MNTTDTHELARELGRQLVASGETVTVAESCTGGLIAKTFTDIDGCSAWFEQSWVTYSNAAKSQQLGVPVGLLARHGAVSAAVVEAMAKGACERSGSSLALSVSGIAGPSGGGPDKPVGTVWIGLASGTIVNSRHYLFSGDRAEVRAMATHEAILGVIEFRNNLHQSGES